MEAAGGQVVHELGQDVWQERVGETRMWFLHPLTFTRAAPHLPSSRGTGLLPLLRAAQLPCLLPSLALPLGLPYTFYKWGAPGSKPIGGGCEVTQDSVRKLLDCVF